MACLSTLRPFVTFSGVLYVYGRMRRLLDSDLRTLRWIECFCGPTFFQNITIVTTKWDELVEDAFEDRWAITADFENHEVVRCLLDPPGRLDGATIYHHGFPGGRGSGDSWSSILSKKRRAHERGDELRNLIRRNYTDKDVGELQIIQELDQGMALCETEAARILASDLKQTIVEISEDSATLVLRPGLDKNYGVLRCHNAVKNSSGKAEDSRGTETRDQPEEHTKEQSKEQSKQQPIEECKEQPNEQPKNRAEGKVKEPSWFERWFQSDWWTVLTEAARFFAEARNGGYQSSNWRGSGPPPAWNPWQAAQNWWGGAA